MSTSTLLFRPGSPRICFIQGRRSAARQSQCCPPSRCFRSAATVENEPIQIGGVGRMDSNPPPTVTDTTQYREGFVMRTKQDAPVLRRCMFAAKRRSEEPGNDVSKIERRFHGILAEYLPGGRGEVMQLGSAKRLPAGSTLVFQVHYAKTITGKVEKDRSRIGLDFREGAAAQAH